MVIAIDGPAGAGKSTVARAVARALGITYLDSGAMYRCVALAALRAGASLDDGVALGRLVRGLEIALADGRVSLDGEDVSEAIRAPGVSAAASRASVHPEVRRAMVERQRALIAAGDYVAEGRDIGTVVSPDAPLKVFLTASDAERARRRAAETGEPLADVLAAQATRDARDRGREHGALRAADDAVEIDTTGQSVDDVVRRIAALAAQQGIGR
jgi:cytidylate kinase